MGGGGGGGGDWCLGGVGIILGFVELLWFWQSGNQISNPKCTLSWYSKGLLKAFQGCFLGVSKKFQGNFMDD